MYAELYVVAAASALASLLYVLIARATLNGRATRTTGVRMLAMWWLSAAAIALLWAFEVVLAARGVTDPRVHLVVFQVMGLAVVLGLWGLTHFVVVLVTGRRDILAATGAGAFAVFVCVQIVLAFADGVSVRPQPWDVEIEMSFGGAQPLASALFVALSFPFLVATIVFAYAAYRAGPGTSRRRAGAVAAAWAAGLAAHAGAFALGLWDAPAWEAVTAAMAPLLAAFIWVAYRPATASGPSYAPPAPA